jgi:putative ABC transport system permease protein
MASWPFASKGIHLVKLFKYIWRNATRNKLRSSLTILSVGFSLALMTVLYGYLAMQDDWQKAAKVYNRVVVLNKQGFSGKLPGRRREGGGSLRLVRWQLRR